MGELNGFLLKQKVISTQLCFQQHEAIKFIINLILLIIFPSRFLY